MKKVLQIITRENDELAEAVATTNQTADIQLKVWRLDPKETDYEQLLKAIFEADSVQCW